MRQQKTPHLQMCELDAAGEAYWLEDIVVRNVRTIARADVLSHSEDWMCIREQSFPVVGLWVPTRDMSFRIVEQ